MRALALLFAAWCCPAWAAGGVLIAGDSVSQGYTPFVQASVAGVEHVPDCPYYGDRTTVPDGVMGNAGNSKRLAACLDLWLDGHSYAVVYFNAGLHDIHVAGCHKGGVQHQVELSDYLINLQTAIDSIRAHGAVPVFATTTPVQGRVDCHYNADIKRYNAAAVALMQSQGVAVDDLYSLMFPVQGRYHLPHNIHFTRAGYKLLAREVSTTLSDLEAP